ncbi:hypothetical protein, partial [Sphingobium sp.]|uniref:hypothetical protein n=1 Tax=Sphingobium sp. TaxID=1912891 RepID=UPI002CB40ECB
MASKPIFDDVAPWPEQAKPNPRAVIGGNQPPLEERIPVEFREAIIAERADFYKKLEDLLGKAATDEEAAKSGAVDRASCIDEETLAKCGVLVKTLSACEKLVNTVHDEVKKPYWDAGKIISAERNALTSQLDAARKKVEGLQRAYFDDQEAKAKAAQAEADAKRAELEELARKNNLEEALPPPPPRVTAAI